MLGQSAQGHRKAPPQARKPLLQQNPCIPASWRNCKAQQLEHTHTRCPGFSLWSPQLFTLPKLHSLRAQSGQDSSPCPLQKSPCFSTGLGPSKTSVLLPAVQMKWKNEQFYKGKTGLKGSGDCGVKPTVETSSQVNWSAIQNASTN